MAFTNQSKTSTSLTNSDKTSTIFDNCVSYLLKEDEFFLLLESGFKIILDQSCGNKQPTTFTNISKI